MATHFFRSQFLAYTQPFKISEPPTPVENPATNVDRAYLAMHNPADDTRGALFSYDRAPIAGEWEMTVPDGSFVRVFAINDVTTVRALHSVNGHRLAEPAIDSWHPSLIVIPAA